MKKNKRECVDLLRKLASEGKKIYAYGASTKGNTILQYYGIGNDLIEGIAEIHPEKIGKIRRALLSRRRVGGCCRLRRMRRICMGMWMR